jgi:hypothetical protein
MRKELDDNLLDNLEKDMESEDLMEVGERVYVNLEDISEEDYYRAFD